MYSGVVDEVEELVIKYSPTSNIIWLGDLNGDLNRSKNYKRDQLLHNFCKRIGFISILLKLLPPRST